MNPCPQPGFWTICISIAPFIIALLIYFVRLERKLAKMSTDLCWIKKVLRDIKL